MPVIDMPKGDVGAMVREMLQPNDMAVDVGAGVGEITQIMRKQVGPDGFVTAIEPQAVGDIPGADVTMPIAIGREPSAMFYIAVPPSLSSFHKRTIAGRQIVDKRSVPMRRLDDVVHAADLVKIDTQGHEVDVLLSAPTLLQRCPTWIVEVWPHGLMCADQSVGALWTILHDAGLRIEDGDGHEITEDRAAAWVLSVSRQEKYTNWLARR